jgi:hypothetical protein
VTVEANSDKDAPLPDGVLVVRALARGGPDGHGLFRLTMGTGTETEPAVVVVASVEELHRAIDEWASTWA